MANDGLEHRESGRGPPEGRGPISLQQHQQVWLCPKTLKKLQSEGLGLGIGWGREGDRKSSKTYAKVLMHAHACVHVRACVRVYAYIPATCFLAFHITTHSIFTFLAAAGSLVSKGSWESSEQSLALD